MSKFDTAEKIGFTHPTEWRLWLEQNHASCQGVWVVSWKKHTGKAAMTYDEMVCEALCFGWIDSKPGKFDEDRGMLWFSPRSEKSAWSKLNKARIARLLTEHKMAPAGLKLVERAKELGTWDQLNEVEMLVVPEDLLTQFEHYPGSLENFNGFNKSSKRAILEWINQAKKEETRQKRVLETAQLAFQNEKANQWKK
jgi:uncharacterized protein YdeI (YjbR/CyaY-like superfamily)